MSEFKFIAASADGKTNPKIVGKAYGGGKMNVGWGDSIVVDLAGMAIPESIPLLANHVNYTDTRVGVITASVVNDTLEIEGEITAESELAQNIVSQARNGGDWQLSIGADASKTEFIEAGKTRVINGQEHSGPFYHVINSTLREVSVVAVGADASTVMKIAAKFNLKGEPQMSSENKENVAIEAAKKEVVNAPVDNLSKITEQDVTAAAETAIKAERKRVADICAVCNGEFPEIEKEAISAGWDVNATREKVLEAFRAKKPETSVNVIVNKDEMNKETLEAAFAMRAGISGDDLIKSYGEKTVDAAAKDCDISIKELMQECMRLEGKYAGRTFDNDSIRAAFSTVSLPGILSNVANKTMLKTFNAQPIIATRLCTEGDLNDFKATERLRLTDVGDLKPVAPNGEIKDGGLTEEAAVNQLETYGKKFCLTRQMIINDDLGALMKVPTAMGNRAARLIDQLFFSRLLANPVQADGNKLFSTAHKNIATGTASALGIESLEKAIQLFLDQTDASGAPIGVEPQFLLVPTALKFKAEALTKGDTIIATGNTASVRTSLNVLANEGLQVISSPYLGNVAYPGASSTGWYLFGNPAQVDTFEIGYLRGKRTPTVEYGETDFNTLGMWFRVYFDLGIREQGHYGMNFSAGV